MKQGISSFIFKLGEISGQLGRKDIQEYLQACGATTGEIENAKKSLIELAGCFYEKGSNDSGDNDPRRGGERR